MKPSNANHLSCQLLRFATLAGLAATLLVSACDRQAVVETYGEPLTLNTTTPIPQILASPRAFIGKHVLIEGEVVDVCQRAGCWIEVAAAGGHEKMRVKVDDGVIVFPQRAIGKQAKMEGEVYEISLTAEQALRYFAHQAEEEGVPFDSSSVTGPVTIYQIKGIGGVIF